MWQLNILTHLKKARAGGLGPRLGGRRLDRGRCSARGSLPRGLRRLRGRLLRLGALLRGRLPSNPDLEGRLAVEIRKKKKGNG